MPARSNSRASTRARDDIFALLKDDHKRVKKVFREFEKLYEKGDAEAAHALVMQTCMELELHATLEEELFYPAAREALREEDLVDEAEVEHMAAKMLIGQLRDMDPDDEKFAATFRVLGEYTKHHIKEEEKEMFEQISRAKIDWPSLLEEMQQRRVELMEEMGLMSEQEDATADVAMAEEPAGKKK